VTVIICAYTEDRWDLLLGAVDSIYAQRLAPQEVVVCVDHNPALFERCRDHWATHGAAVPTTVVENRYDGHLGSARRTAAEIATGEFLAFLDDDAAAEPEWLERMLGVYEDPQVIAVGGSPRPLFATGRPRWFPPECDWVFGCAYEGLPTTAAPVLHVIGAAMSVRRADLAAIGYFHSDNHDDMDMCHRLLDYAPGRTIVYEPDAVVRHFVSADRVTWTYFWRRCFFVNRGKVAAFRGMGAASNLRAERTFARRALTEGVGRGLRQLWRGDPGGLLRSGALCLGVGLAGLGYATGSVEWRLSQRRRDPATPG
jgi:glycosyltransferase involved in cell wall biosynthesis